MNVYSIQINSAKSNVPEYDNFGPYHTFIVMAERILKSKCVSYDAFNVYIEQYFMTFFCRTPFFPEDRDNKKYALIATCLIDFIEFEGSTCVQFLKIEFVKYKHIK